MAPRKRIHPGADNLYWDKTNRIYRYLHPVTKKYHSMGADLSRARAAAKVLNEKLCPAADLITRVMGGTLLRDFIDTFTANIFPTLGLAASTRRDYLAKIKIIRAQLGTLPITVDDVSPFATFLDQFPGRQSDLYRSVLMLLFKHAAAKGARSPSLGNPVKATLPKNVETKRQRLGISDFWDIYHAQRHSQQNAMLLALVTLQRREDLTRFRPQDVQNGYLKFTQNKTGVPLALSLDISIEQWSLAEVIDRCRDMIGPRYILHHDMKSKRCLVGKKLSPDTLTKNFSDARDKLGIGRDLPPRERPSFHEIRAMGAQLYQQAGYTKEWVNLLLGHGTMEMTDLYLSRHQVNYIQINAV